MLRVIVGAVLFTLSLCAPDGVDVVQVKLEPVAANAVEENRKNVENVTMEAIGVEEVDMDRPAFRSGNGRMLSDRAWWRGHGQQRNGISHARHGDGRPIIGSCLTFEEESCGQCLPHYSACFFVGKHDHCYSDSQCVLMPDECYDCVMAFPDCPFGAQDCSLQPQECNECIPYAYCWSLHPDEDCNAMPSNCMTSCMAYMHCWHPLLSSGNLSVELFAQIQADSFKKLGEQVETAKEKRAACDVAKLGFEWVCDNFSQVTNETMCVGGLAEEQQRRLRGGDRHRRHEEDHEGKGKGKGEGKGKAGKGRDHNHHSTSHAQVRMQEATDYYDDATDHYEYYYESDDGGSIYSYVGYDYY